MVESELYLQMHLNNLRSSLPQNGIAKTAYWAFFGGLMFYWDSP